ncbi:hypothetical protein C0995_013854 [Termitomyces sp. Mi166|nr:hypothetical protein C0995_013854 [Termitomyces sp. Mi166\
MSTPDSKSLADIFTLTSAYSLGGVVLLATVATFAAHIYLPSNSRSVDKYTFIWLGFDALIHFFFEGSFLYLSVFGRQVNTSTGPFAAMCA